MGNTKFDTCFFERYAMISLSTILGKKYSTLVNEDRPDLQAPDHSLGIEVTRAMEENKAVADSLLLEMAGIMIPEDQDKAADEEDYRQIIDSGYAYGLQNGRYIGRKEYDYWALAQPLRRIIASKVGKVSSGFYGDFDEFGLYIFCKDQLSEKEIRMTMDYTSALQEKNETGYSTLYISLIDRLYVCGLEDGSTRWHDISTGMCRSFFRQALQQ